MLLELCNVKKHFSKRNAFKKSKVVKAVDNVSLSVERGETFGLVGESGSGKTTLARLIMGMIKLSAGAIKFDGKELDNLTPPEADLIRRQMGIVFQNPYSSLNPRMTVFDIIAEPIEVYRLAKGNEKKERIIALMEDVGLTPDLHLYRYPHEFSGGQRQRIAVARTMSFNPQFIILDEPTSALDVSVQAQILNLLAELKYKKRMTYFLISHNMGVIHHMCDRVGVMYLGSIVEIGTVSDIFEKAAHPYTKCLIDAIPDLEISFKTPMLAKSGVINNKSADTGCLFAPRCLKVTNECRQQTAPMLKEVSPGHWVSCYLV
jgi:oligopeptide/dipeptide ABC transporter ATP-binding protein